MDLQYNYDFKYQTMESNLKKFDSSTLFRQQFLLHKKTASIRSRFNVPGAGVEPEKV